MTNPPQLRSSLLNLFYLFGIQRFPRSIRSRKSLFLLILPAYFFFFAPCSTLSAQQPEAASSTAQVPPAPLDTTPFLFTFSVAPERSYAADDTLPDLDFRMYDPARRQLVDYGTLGNTGSSARPLFFETQARLGFDPGFHGFDLYGLKPADLQFYRNSRSFTDLFFSQGKIQNDNTLRARFSRTFSEGLNFSLQYSTLNHLGQYRYQAVKHTAFAVGIWYMAGPRYETFLIFSKNSAKQQENGGIVTDTVFGGGEFSGPIDAAVRLPDRQALAKQADWSLHLTHHLKFTGLGDSLGKRVLRASHTLEWKRQSFKFSDPGSNPGETMGSDTFFYDTFLVDRRGIRNFWELNTISNTLTINTFKSKKPGRPSDELALGLTHSLFKLGQEPAADSLFSNLFLTANLAITPSERFAFIAHGNLGVITNFGEYLVQGALKIGLGKAGEFKATLTSQRYPPSMVFNRLYVSKRLVWDNNFSKPVETALSASYALPLIGLEATGKTQLINNYLYFNQHGLATQTTAPLQIAQLLIRENLHLGGVHLDNTLALQRSNRSEVLRLPKWFTKNSLYFAGSIFQKRLYLNAGVDFRLNSEFQPDGYQPVTAQYYLQDSVSAKPFPWVDMFVSIKVNSFRFFAKYENFTTLWDDRTVFYQTARYPQPFGAIRLGVGWRFLDSNRETTKNAGNTGSGNGGPPTGLNRGF